MILALVATLQQQPQQLGYDVLHVPPVPDTIGVFWSAAPAVRDQAQSPGFRQLGAFSPPDRIVMNPCGDAQRLDRFGVSAVAKLLADSVHRTPQNAGEWFRLGCARSLLNWPLGRGLDREEYLLSEDGPAGAGAIAAFLRVLAQRPHDSTALVALVRETLRGAPGRLAPGDDPAPRRLAAFACGTTRLAGSLLLGLLVMMVACTADSNEDHVRYNSTPARTLAVWSTSNPYYIEDLPAWVVMATSATNGAITGQYYRASGVSDTIGRAWMSAGTGSGWYTIIYDSSCTDYNYHYTPC